MRHQLATLAGVVQRTIRRHSLIAAGDRVLVAVSGGADSAGLALLLSELRQRLGCELVLAHVHHGLRGAEADAGAAAAAAVAAELGQAFVRADIPIDRGGNLEARARAARYAALHELARAAGCTRIATGHTRDDQAETFLLRLLRGAGAEGLAGIRPRRDDGVIRPLLDCDRAAVAAVVGERGLIVCADSMNDDPRFLRTRVRHELLPLMRELNPQIAALAARSADALRAAAAAQEEWADAQLGAPADDLPLSSLQRMAPDLRAALLHSWLRRMVPGARLSSRLVAGVAAIAESGSPGASIDIAPGWRVEHHGDRLRPARTGAAAPILPTLRLRLGTAQELPGGWLLRSEVCHRPVPLPADLWGAVCDLDECDELLVRPPRAGERARPLGMKGSRKLAEIFAAQRIPRAARATYPVIASGEELLWVPGIVRSAAMTIDESTSRVGVLTVERVAVAGGYTP